jgi:hypothetical protein
VQASVVAAGHEQVGIRDCHSRTAPVPVTGARIVLN